MSMSNNPFSRPASATGIQWNDHKGKLLLVEPKSYETGIATSLGEKDAVRADVTIVDGPSGPEEYVDTLIFPRALIAQTRSLIGEKVLGRLGQGQAKPGQNAPWRIDDPTEADITTGVAFLKHREAKNPFATPAQAQPPF
jgi:hypothetical protein